MKLEVEVVVLVQLVFWVQGVSEKTHHKVLFTFCKISLATIIQESWDIFQMKDDINRYALSTISFLSNIREVRYRHNDSGYQIIEIVKFRLIPCS